MIGYNLSEEIDSSGFNYFTIFYCYYLKEEIVWKLM